MIHKPIGNPCQPLSGLYLIKRIFIHILDIKAHPITGILYNYVIYNETVASIVLVFWAQNTSVGLTSSYFKILTLFVL